MHPVQTLIRRHEVLMYICVMLSFLAVAFGGTGVVMNALFVMGWAASWFAFKYGLAQRVPTGAWNALILGSVALTGAQMYLSDESIIAVGVRFILLLLLIKLFSRKGAERDDWQIYALSFLLMAAGTALNEDVAYGALFATYVFFVTFGLALFHMRTEAARHQRIQREGMGRVYQAALAILAGGVLLSSVAIFFVFPRVGLGFFAPKSRATQAMTGFSDKVELGSHGVIRDNPEVVLRVEFPGYKGMPPEASSYHWRMMSFATYDGVKWARSLKPRESGLAFDSKTRRYDLGKLYSPALNEVLDNPSSQGRTLRVYMEPLGVSQGPQIWPTLAYELPQAIPLPFNPKSAWLRHDSVYQDLYIQQRNEMGIILEMRLATQPDPRIFREETFTSPDDPNLPGEIGELEPFLQLPTGLSRMRQLAASLTRPEQTPYQKAELLREHLQTSYTYTTNLPPVDPDNPIEGFLFETKQGHCEFFATSMVLMLRASGVPARLVNGFLGGVWNSSGDYMAVRQGDAHAWVEVYIPRYGWVPFDPTPSAGTVPLQNEGIGATLREIYDAARMNWMRYVIEYDLDNQLEGLRALSKMLSPGGKSFLSGSDSKQAQEPEEEVEPGGWGARDVVIWALFALLLWRSWRAGRRYFDARQPASSWLKLSPAVWLGLHALFFCGVGALWLGWMFEWDVARTLVGALGPAGIMAAAVLLGANFGASPQQRTQGLFASLERAVARHGVSRRADEGPAEFLARLRQLFPAHAQRLHGFERSYLRARFASEPLSPQDTQEFSRLLRELRAAQARIT